MRGMKCDGCTLCCYVLPVVGRSKRAYEQCRDCETGVGCRAYDDRPPECIGYQCAYKAEADCSVDLMPDRCGVIFERIRGDIMLGSMIDDASKDSDKVRGQVAAFRRGGLSVVLHSGPNTRRHILTAPGVSADVVMCHIELAQLAVPL